MDVAATAHAAVSHGDALAVVSEVGHKLAGFLGFLEVFVDHGAHRHLEHQVGARGAVHATALAVRAALGLEVMLEAVIDQRGHAGIGFKHHVAAMAAVAAIGTALGHMGLAAKRHAAGAAVAALDVDSDLINEHDVTSIGLGLRVSPDCIRKSPLQGRGLRECIDATHTRAACATPGGGHARDASRHA